MLENSTEILVAVIVTIITIILVLFHRFKNGNYERTSNQLGGAAASTCPGACAGIPDILVKHARSCGRRVHEVACGGESMFSSLADQLQILNPDSVYTGQSLQQVAADDPRLRGHAADAPHDDHSWLQVVANLLRRRIFVYRDDPNPPYCIQPDISFAGQGMQELYLGCITNNHYVSLRPLQEDTGTYEDEPAYEPTFDVQRGSSGLLSQCNVVNDKSPDPANNEEDKANSYSEDDASFAALRNDTALDRSDNVEHGQNPSVDGASAADIEDDTSYDDTESESFEMVQFGNSNIATINLTHDEGCTVHRSVQVLNYGDDNSVRLVINIPQPLLDYGNRMINRGAELKDEHIGMKIEISAMSQEDIDRAETEILQVRHGMQQDINALINHRGVELVYLGSGCILLNFKPDSWKSAMQFVTDVYYGEFMEMFAVLFSLPVFPSYFPLFEKVCVNVHINKPVTTAPEASSEKVDSVSADKHKFIKDGSRYMMKRFYRENGPSSRRLLKLGPLRKIEGVSEAPRHKLMVEARFKPIQGSAYENQPDILLEDIAKTVARDIVSRTNIPASGVDVRYFESAESEGDSDVSQTLKRFSKMPTQFNRVHLYQQKFGSSIVAKCLKSLLIETRFLKADMFDSQAPGRCAWQTARSSICMILIDETPVGTGFKMGNSMVMTAYHVVELAKGRPLLASFTEDSVSVHLSDVYRTPQNDVALIQMRGRERRNRPLSLKKAGPKREPFYLLGHPHCQETPIVERCLLPSDYQHQHDVLYFQSKHFVEGSSGSPCLVYRDEQFHVIAMLIGKVVGEGPKKDLHCAVKMDRLCM